MFITYLGECKFKCYPQHLNNISYKANVQDTQTHIHAQTHIHSHKLAFAI